MPVQMKNTKTKACRRGNNEGTIYRRKDGRWCGQVTTGYKWDGKPIRKPIYGKTRQDVAKKVAEKVAEVNKAGYVSVAAISNDERIFEAIMNDWFLMIGSANMSANTASNRRGTLKNSVYKKFSKKDIRDITEEMLQKFFNDLVKNGRSADTVNTIKNLTKSFFTYAKKKDYVIENPMQDIVIKKRPTTNGDKKEKALRPEIRQQVFTAAMDNAILKPILILFTLSGLRPQELMALEWRHVGLSEKTVKVEQAVKRMCELDDDGNAISRWEEVGTTKTPMSMRVLSIDETTVAALTEWKDYCSENGIVSKYVFPNTKTGKIRTYSGLRSLLTRFIKRHGFESEGITLYSFRHTFATMMLEQGINPRIGANNMGHVKTTTYLDIYSHVMTNSLYEKTAQKLDGVFAGYISPTLPQPDLTSGSGDTNLLAVN